MPSMEIGRICVKTSGREALRRCVLLDIIDQNFGLVTGPKEVSGVRRRRVNLSHIEPTPDKIDIEKNASDADVLKAIEKANLMPRMKQKVSLD